MSTNNIFILDTETTGINPEDQVIEIAHCGFPRLEDVLDFSWPNSPPTTFVRKYKPSVPITWGALSTHNIILSDLEDCPPSSEATLPLACDYLIGHNIDFDWRMLGSDLSVKRIDTLAMARDLYPELDSHKLTAMMYFIHGATAETRPRLARAHSAFYDVIFCAELLAHICAQKNIRDIEDLYAYSEEARVPKIMTFGKHKGEPVASVPYGYIKWYKAQPDPDPYLIAAFDRASNTRYGR